MSTIKAQHYNAGLELESLEKKFQILSQQVYPETKPDEPQPEPDLKQNLELSILGITLASKKKEKIQLERKIVLMKRNAGLLPAKEADEQNRTLTRRYFSAGDQLWMHQKKKVRLQQDVGKIRLLDPRCNAVSECLLALYRKSDGQGQGKRRRPSEWRANALTYYKARIIDHDLDGIGGAWCHVSGCWHPEDDIKAAHIVPFFLDSSSIGEILFGSRAESLNRPGNALLLSRHIKGWFDSHHLVIIPVDPMETPITRWRTELISDDIRKSLICPEFHARELDGKELTFLNENRPVSRFLYFHFIMALIRIKDLKRRGWETIWARYYDQRPFPTPGPYMRKSMLLAIATHFETTDIEVVNSWIKGNGFETAELELTKEEADQAARLVLEAVEAAETKTDLEENPDEEDYSEKDSVEKDYSEEE